MVKFRGIEISIISQFDIRKLPEFRLRQYSPLPPHVSNPATASQSHPAKAVASCYVPIYPGSQIWFEYCIDGPHPPSSAYFFKFLLNGKVVTSWDCTEKHGYHGKMMYNLTHDGHDYETGATKIIRQALNFSSEIEDHNDTTETKDVIEIRVHRIEHRKRIRDLAKDLSDTSVQSNEEGNLQLSNGGLLEPGLPARRYKYQLLDPVDEPYATFRFYYRTYVPREKWHRQFSAASIIKPLLAPETSDGDLVIETSSEEVDTEANESGTGRSSPTPYTVQMISSPSALTCSSTSQGGEETTKSGPGLESYLPPSDSDESLSIVTKDSIEDLPSNVPRSPRSTRFPDNREVSEHGDESITSHAESPPLSPRRRLKKKLTVNINGAEFDLERKKRPLSPFTNSGMLRRLTGGIPPSAPAAVTEFAPTLEDEVHEKLKAEQKPGNFQRTSRAERGGKSLMGFLGRRIGSA